MHSHKGMGVIWREKGSLAEPRAAIHCPTYTLLLETCSSLLFFKERFPEGNIFVSLLAGGTRKEALIISTVSEADELEFTTGVTPQPSLALGKPS